jgi:1-deoxy-D-xylulose-5-phosphate synthase
MPILDNLKSPADLKPLNAAQRKELAGEIRRKIIETVSKNGGHLATNLGSVELTLARQEVRSCSIASLGADRCWPCVTSVTTESY